MKENLPKNLPKNLPNNLPQHLPQHAEVIIIGAGPAGAAMASWLADHGVCSIVLEKETFPRFSIGESLLPEALNCLEEVGLLDVVEAANYQYKDGATFVTNESRYDVDFADSYSSGKKYAYQVPRADFDHRLINRCAEKGVEVFYQTKIKRIEPLNNGYQLWVDSNGEEKTIVAGFLVDASGFGRVLARLFKLDKPSLMSKKKALFCHVETDLAHPELDRNKILIAQTRADIAQWYWLIPFTGGTCSAGVVMDDCHNDGQPVGQKGSLQQTHEKEWHLAMEKQRMMSDLVNGKPLIREIGSVSAYSCSVSKLYGERYVILGNAGEFIDPIFSSGVTIALKSALLAAPLVLEAVTQRQTPDWENRFHLPLMQGVDTFKEFVMAWYAGILPRLFYADMKSAQLNSAEGRRMISAILAGYVWDRSNPFTRMSVGNLQSLLAWV